MKHRADFQPRTVVLNFGSGAWSEAGTGGAVQDSGGSFVETGVLDPHRIAYEEPIRWAAFVNAVYPRDAELRLHFGVGDKTIGYWRRGERAPRAHSRTLAERLHGDDLRRYMHGGDVVGGKLRI